MEHPSASRRYDLDWLRVIAFALLMLFHTGMLFSSWNWHVKNLETSPWFDYVMRFLHEWRMPLLFFISGAAVWFLLERATLARFFWSRQQRLLIPLIFGMLVVIPPQVYHERLFQQQAYTSFADFYRDLFSSGSYPSGNISWHHLWYIPYIWAYSILLLPLFALARTSLGTRALHAIQELSAHPACLFLIFLPSALIEILLRPYWPGDACNLIDDWANFTHKLSFFAAGYFLAPASRTADCLARHRRLWLVAGLASLSLLFPIWFFDVRPPGLNPATYRLLSNFHIWMWILAALGFARQYLSFNHPFLKQANAAVYPFYILHQTVIVILGYYIVRLNWSLPSKFLLVVSLTFFVCLLLYQGLLCRFRFTRLCFGLKPQRSSEKPDLGSTKASAPLPQVLSCARVALPALAVFALASLWPIQSSRLLYVDHRSAALAGNLARINTAQPMAVYLPPSYDREPTRVYPVLYFLPNFNTPLWRYTGGGFQDFRFKPALDRLLAESRSREMIVVIPNALHTFGASWYADNPFTGNWEQHIAREVVATVDARFRTERSPQGRAIVGHGMGGNGALNLALRYPKVFGHVYALSPAVFPAVETAKLGLTDMEFLHRWRRQVAAWEHLSEDQQYRAFRQYFTTRLNHPNRSVFMDALRLSCLAALTYDPALPYPHFGLPDSTEPLDPEFNSHVNLGMGDWDTKLRDYLAREPRLASVNIEFGEKDEFGWLQLGVRELSQKLSACGVPHQLNVHSGGHDSALGDRLEKAMLPAIAHAFAAAYE